jgi:hypothetical protein
MSTDRNQPILRHRLEHVIQKYTSAVAEGAVEMKTNGELTHETHYRIMGLQTQLSSLLDAVNELQEADTTLLNLRRARPRDEWEWENGDVLWWRFPVVEPPFVGHMGNENFPDYVTHWTPLPPLPYEEDDGQ